MPALCTRLLEVALLSRRLRQRAGSSSFLTQARRILRRRSRVQHQQLLERCLARQHRALLRLGGISLRGGACSAARGGAREGRRAHLDVRRAPHRLRLARRRRCSLRGGAAQRVQLGSRLRQLSAARGGQLREVRLERLLLLLCLGSLQVRARVASAQSAGAHGASAGLPWRTPRRRRRPAS